MSVGLSSVRFDDKMQKKSWTGGIDMEWLPIAVLAIFIVIIAVYFTVKWAVKDALKEYFKDKRTD